MAIFLEHLTSHRVNLQRHKGITMKTCLVTGASGGIGREIAKALSQQGYRVLLQGRNNKKLEALKQEIGNSSDILVGDLNLTSDRDAIIRRLHGYSDIELLINAAGISHFSAFSSMSESKITELITTNLISTMLFIRAFIGMKSKSKNSQKVTIVNIGSAFGYIGYPGFSVYAASKFGLRGFTETMRREYAGTLFSFAYFAPRATQTEINSEQVNKMNKAIGNKVDSPIYVAKQFVLFLQKHKCEATIGWPEKLFVRVNSLLPKLVDNAIKSKMPVIREFMGA